MYAKEKVRPKLYDMDQEKLSRLFADLRRESLATGSYPITVRHLESMIRMAEASAKMALREYVRADDIDLAISVAVGSFVSAQKMSIKRTLERVSLPSYSSCANPPGKPIPAVYAAFTVLPDSGAATCARIRVSCRVLSSRGVETSTVGCSRPRVGRLLRHQVRTGLHTSMHLFSCD